MLPISIQRLQNLLLKKKTVSAVVFLLGASLFNLLFFGSIKQTQASNYSMGGPIESEAAVSLHSSFSSENNESANMLLEDASLVSHGNLIEDSMESDLPDLRGYFSIPTIGWNWGTLHRYNAIDIANACGTPIYAAAEGVVKESGDGWNGGYGTYLIISHPNETSTKYAHSKKNLVNVGQYVLRGDLIAYMGNTGNTHGATGCHLHFEIRGAKNPFASR